MMRKRKQLWIAGAALVAAAGVLGGFLLTHVRLDGEFFPKNAAVYDLTDHELSPEAYREACGRFPEAQVLWTVPFQGARYPMDTQSIQISSLTKEEAEYLDFLPELKTVDAGLCTDYEALACLQARRPECEVFYRLNVGSESCDSMTRELTVTDASFEELSAALPLLPRLEMLNLTGSRLTDEELKTLIRQFPEMFLSCQLDFAGEPVSRDAETVDLTGREFTLEDLENGISWFPKMKKLILGQCGIADEDLDALNNRYPDTRIVWSMQVGLVLVQTDDIVFYPAKISETHLPTDEDLARLRYCTDMIAVDVGHSRATNCEWAAYMPHLRYLILADTWITDISPLSNLKELVYLELFTTKVTDYSPLLGCTALQDLNIGTTWGDPAPIAQMTWLHNLHWHNGAERRQYREAVRELPDKLPDTNVLLKADRNTGPPWRYVPNYYVFRDIIGGLYFNQGLLRYWGPEDQDKIMATEYNEAFAGDVLAEIIRYRIDNGIPIPGLKNLDSEKAEILYETMKNARPDEDVLKRSEVRK